MNRVFSQTTHFRFLNPLNTTVRTPCQLKTLSMTPFAKLKSSSFLLSLVLQYLKCLNPCPQCLSLFAEALSLLLSELTFKAKVGSYCLETQDLSQLSFTSSLDTHSLRPDHPAIKARRGHHKKR